MIISGLVRGLYPDSGRAYASQKINFLLELNEVYNEALDLKSFEIGLFKVKNR